MRRRFVGLSASVAPVDGPVDGAWTNMVLVGATPDATNLPQYMKDSRGFVHCRGKLTATVAATTIFTFPAGFLPVGGAASINHFYWQVSPHACSVGGGGELQMGFTALADLSVVHFATALSA